MVFGRFQNSSRTGRVARGGGSGATDLTGVDALAESACTSAILE
jgi:hypothetical protein